MHAASLHSTGLVRQSLVEYFQNMSLHLMEEGIYRVAVICKRVHLLIVYNICYVVGI